MSPKRLCNARKYFDLKLTGMNSKLMKMAKIADRFALPESVRQMIETQNKFKALLPKIDIPTYNFPKFDMLRVCNLTPSVRTSLLIV